MFLATSIDKNLSHHSLKDESPGKRQHALEGCRTYKAIFKEVKERSSKALGFAKMLQKDLGVAATYDIMGSLADVFRLLEGEENGRNSKAHVLVSFMITLCNTNFVRSSSSSLNLRL